MSHVDLEQVADLDGGVLQPEQERAVRAHLETCDQCSQLLERVREVHTLLAAEPAPQLPAAIANRLDDSLAAAGRDREARTRVVSLERARSRRNTWASRLLAAAVGLVVVGGGAYVAQNVLGSNSDSTASTGAVAGRNPEAGGAAYPKLAVPPNLRFNGDALRPQLLSAFGGKLDRVRGLANDQSVPAALNHVAAGCVSSALGARTPGNWVSYRVTFDSRPAVLVLSRAGVAGIKAWIVECQPSPTVNTSTVIPNP